jgi:hypothetical protein
MRVKSCVYVMYLRVYVGEIMCVCVVACCPCLDSLTLPARCCVCILCVYVCMQVNCVYVVYLRMYVGEFMCVCVAPCPCLDSFALPARDLVCLRACMRVCVCVCMNVCA